MARIGQLFGGRANATDRDGDGIDDRAENPGDVEARREAKQDAAETTTWRLRPKHDKDRDGVDDRVETKSDIPPVRTMERDTETLKPSIDRDPIETVPVRPAPARVSLLATFGLIFGVVAVAAALSGLLAVWAIVIGALGLLFSFGGIIAGVRPHVAGRGLGTLGVLLSGAAVVFGIIAMTGQVSWLDTDTDQVARLNDWLDARMPWMKDW